MIRLFRHCFLYLLIVLPLVDGSARRSVHSLNDGWTFSSRGVSEAVHLPHSWNVDAYSTRDYFRGEGIYERELFIPDSLRGSRLYLKFDGAASKSQVSVNGAVVGSHVGAYSPHIVDVTSQIGVDSVAQLRVAVDNSDKDVPPFSADYTFMGGLYRDAWLIAMPDLHFDIVGGPAEGFKVTSSLDGTTGCISVAARVVNHSAQKAKPRVEFKIYNSTGDLVAEKSERVAIPAEGSAPVEIEFRDLAGVDLWSPESPSLYRVVGSIVDGKATLDEAWSHTAFRTYGFDDNGRFMLNGRPYKLRGMCRHQDQWPMGIALTDEQHRRDIQLIKELGANFIRISHYPQDDAILEMCDRLGLIVWEEIPVIDFVPVGDAFAANCATMLRDMIRSHYNHPSVAFWGYMNEILLRVPAEYRDSTIVRTLDLARRLENVLHEEDATRLSAMAFHGSDAYNECGLAEVAQLKGWNLYQGWYGGRFSDFEAFLSRQHRDYPSRAIIVSEYGAGSDLRIHSLSPQTFDFSMEYQQLYLEHYLPIIEGSTFVAGASHWNFIDFSSANRAESMPHINNKGLVTNSRRKKDVYYFYKAAWHEPAVDSVAYIATRDWSARSEIVDERGFVVRPIKVYTNLPAVALEVNGGAAVVADVHNHTALFDVRLKPGVNILRLLSTDDCAKVLDATTIDLSAIRSTDGRLDLGTAEFAVNVGSNCYYTSAASGLTWLPDNEYTDGGIYGYVGGRDASTTDEISLTDDQPLLQRSRAELSEYRVDVLPGSYEVELTFVDLASPSALSAYMLGRDVGEADRRLSVMDVAINGCRVETDFAPARLSGVKTMVRRRYFATATADSGIVVQFAPAGGGIASLAAIKIRKL